MTRGVTPDEERWRSAFSMRANKGQLLNRFCDHHELLDYTSRFVHGWQTTICHDSGWILYLIWTDKWRMKITTEIQDTVSLVETKSGTNQTLIKNCPQISRVAEPPAQSQQNRKNKHVRSSSDRRVKVTQLKDWGHSKLVNVTTKMRHSATRGTFQNEVEGVPEYSLMDPLVKSRRQRIHLSANKFQSCCPRQPCTSWLSWESGTYQKRRNLVSRD